MSVSPQFQRQLSVYAGRTFAGCGGVGQLPGVDVCGQTELHKSYEYNKNRSCEGILRR